MSPAKAKQAARKAALRDDIEAQRQRLFQAHAIIETARLALASKLETLDIETTVGDALQGALRIVDDVAAALEGIASVSTS